MTTILDREHAIDCEQDADGVFRPVDYVDRAIGAVEDIIGACQMVRGATGQIRARIRNAIRKQNPRPKRRKHRNPDFVEAEEI